MSARILVIEDEALVAMELRFVLEDLGHKVIGTVADGGPVFDVVQAGNAIQLETAASVYDYPLAGSRTALNALATCLGLAMGR